MKELANKIIDALTAKLNPVFEANQNNIEFESELDIAAKLAEELGEVYGWYRMWANFNYQVLNNGMVGGYIGNLYHTTGDHESTECNITEAFIKRTKALIENDELDCIEELKALVEILQEVHIEIDREHYVEETCGDCHGDGFTIEENDEKVDCNMCNNGEIEVMNINYGEITTECSDTLKDLGKQYADADMEEAILFALNKKLNLVTV